MKNQQVKQGNSSTLKVLVKKKTILLLISQINYSFIIIKPTTELIKIGHHLKV